MIEKTPYEELVNKYRSASELNKKYVKEIEKLHSIIKEVREYIRSNEWGIDYEHSNCRTHLLEILDKVEE